MTETIPHVLPGEAGGDTGWFKRLNPFEQQETGRQVKFKSKTWPGLPDGRYSKLPQHTYPHILPVSDPPDENLKKAFYPPLAEAILDYMRESKIAPHSELFNLRSSQAACFNFLFPLRQDPALAARVLGQFFPALQRVNSIEFEYTGEEDYPGKDGVVDWLGKPSSGRRGQNRTSIDAAVFWEDAAGQAHAALVEWKYTERGYGVCSAFSRAGAAEKAACQGLDVRQHPAPEQVCLLCSGKRHRQRRYWEHMPGAGIDLAAFRGVAGCPFQGPFYCASIGE